MPDPIQTFEVPAAIWSAVAATFAAIATFLVWRTEQQSFRHSARPKIVLAGWKRDSDVGSIPTPERLSFSAIENAGRGLALHVHINAFSLADDERPMVVMSTVREALIATKASATVNGDISVWWKNVPGVPGAKTLPINIEIYCWDTTGVRYLTEYSLFIAELSRSIVVSDEVAPGVMLGTRSVTAEAVWRLKAKRRLSTVPFVGRLFRSK